MKKYLLQLSALMLLAVSFVSCDEDLVYYDEAKGPALSAFVTTSGLLGCTPTNNERIIEVEVSTLSTSVRAISLTIDAGNTTAVPGEYVIDQATLIIPANEYVGKIRITSNYYDPALTKEENLAKPEKTLAIKLVSVEGASLEKGDSAFSLTIFNTCDYEGLPGNSYTASVIINPAIANVVPPSYVPVITPVGQPGADGLVREYSINTLWGPNFVYTVSGGSVPAGQYPAPARIIINKDLSLTIIPTDVFITPVSGVYDTCNNVFRYTLKQNLFATEFTVSVTLNPN
ncbi:MAG: hypothetical protein ACI7YS_00420 [Flavobacterium sp.]